MRYFIILIALIFSGCDFDYEVKCEEPYFKGKASQVWSDETGTQIYTFDRRWIRYPPSVKCESIMINKGNHQ